MTMVKTNILKAVAGMLLLTAMTTSCMDKDWDTPDVEANVPYGNNDLQETHVMTISQLKERYLSQLTKATDTVRIADDVQIKGRVTGNDIQGNIYSEIALQDSTGAILVCVSQGGLNGYLPVGQELLISLKGLYIGLYGNMPQIGTPYTNTGGNTFPSRMNAALWGRHFKLLGKADASLVQPEVFDVNRMQDEAYVKACRGKLMTLQGVEMADAGKAWAPTADKDAGNGVSRQVKVNGKASSNLVVRSSTYADFAADIIPAGKVNLTGIFTIYATNPARYGYTWQILLRSDKDIESVK